VSERTTDAIHFYWRRGCGFCTRLRHGLDQLGIGTVDHDIWADPDDAATVRFYANGNETVPTVVIGSGPSAIGLVNPTARQVAQHLQQFAPHLLPDGFELPPQGLVGRLLGA
jgi:glutaredoxin